MSPDRVLLSERDVSAAARRVGRYSSLPGVVILDQYPSEIEKLNQAHHEVAGEWDKERALEGRLEFLIKPFMEAMSFQLGPLEIVAIWSKAVEVFRKGFRETTPRDFYPSPYRMALARIIPGVYAVHGLEGGWDRFPYLCLEYKDNNPPADLLNDKKGCDQVRRRIAGVIKSLEDLRDYEWYAPGDSAALTEAYLKGNQEAKKQLEQRELFRRQRHVATYHDIEFSFSHSLRYASRLVSGAK